MYRKPWLFSTSDLLCFPSADFLNLSLQKLPCNGQCVSVKKHLKQQGEGDGVRLFLVAPSDCTRGNGHKLEHRRLPLSVRKYIFPVESDGALAQAVQRGCQVLGNFLKISGHHEVSVSPLVTPVKVCCGWQKYTRGSQPPLPVLSDLPACWGFAAPSSRSLIKVLNRTRPSIDRGGAPAAIGFQLDFVLLIFAEVTCLDPVSYQEESIMMPVFLVPCKVCWYCRSLYQTLSWADEHLRNVYLL